MATLSLRRLWTIYKRMAVYPGASRRELIRTRLAFCGGARGVLKVLSYLMVRGTKLAGRQSAAIIVALADLQMFVTMP
jgi:hypothetical protein